MMTMSLLRDRVIDYHNATFNAALHHAEAITVSHTEFYDLKGEQLMQHIAAEVLPQMNLSDYGERPYADKLQDYVDNWCDYPADYTMRNLMDDAFAALYDYWDALTLHARAIIRDYNN